MPAIPIIDPNEPPRRRARRRLTTLAYQTLAQLLDELVECGQPLTVSVYDRRAKARLVLRWTAFDGETWEPAPKLAPANSPPGSPPLRAVEEAAIRHAPGHGERPVSVRALARKAGYKDSGHWREALRGLIDRGLLVRVRGGVRRA